MSPSGGGQEKNQPSYNLADVQAAFVVGNYKIGSEDGWQRITSYLLNQGWDEDNVRDVISQLTLADFHKSQPHTKYPGIWLDIYKPTYEGDPIYVKFHIAPNGVIYILKSFWNDGST